jgi:2-dehydro-3-deoxygalactonokinase
VSLAETGLGDSARAARATAMRTNPPPRIAHTGGVASPTRERETIVVDWGTSAFRAWRVGAGGRVLGQRADPQGGILGIAPGGFDAALRRRLADWLVAGTTVWLAGMVTSRNGWVETPYVPVPATVRDLARAALELDLGGGIGLRFVPGVSQRVPTPDVMRGEEMQVFGQLALDGDAGGAGAAPEQGGAVFVLPGTHSKWVRVRAGAIEAFRTYLTGELYALLTRHSIVGRLIPDGAAAPRDAAFERGVRDALAQRPGGMLHDVFTARSAVLLGALDPGDVADYLSGLLIGHELHAELAQRAAAPPPVLIGTPGLVARYRRAFAIGGVAATAGAEDAALHGLLALASTSARQSR